jgi:excisionase family DNA binding protein
VGVLGDERLTVAEIAGILKLNQQTVRNWIDEGSLPALHVGRRVRVRRSDFDALLERGRTVRPAEPSSSAGQASGRATCCPCRWSIRATASNHPSGADGRALDVT